MQAGLLRHKILGSQSERGQAPLPFSSCNLSHLESGVYTTDRIVIEKDHCFLFWVSGVFFGFVLVWFCLCFLVVARVGRGLLACFKGCVSLGTG